MPMSGRLVPSLALCGHREHEGRAVGLITNDSSRRKCASAHGVLDAPADELAVESLIRKSVQSGQLTDPRSHNDLGGLGSQLRER